MNGFVKGTGRVQIEPVPCVESLEAGGAACGSVEREALLGYHPEQHPGCHGAVPAKPLTTNTVWRQVGVKLRLGGQIPGEHVEDVEQDVVARLQLAESPVDVVRVAHLDRCTQLALDEVDEPLLRRS